MNIIAHRCGTDKYPELTVDAAHYSLSLGAAYVELDIRFTNDGLPVVNHDRGCRKLFGVDKNVDDISSEEFLSLKRLDNESCSANSLEQFYQSGIEKVLMHIKEGGNHLPAVYELCRKYNIEEKVIFGVTNAEDLNAAKKLNRNTAALAFMPDISDLNSFIDAGADIIRLWEQWVTKADIEAIKKLNREVWIMANNRHISKDECGFASNESLLLWKKWGADGVLVNNVKNAIELISFYK